MLKNPHRWIVAFIWGMILLPFDLLNQVKTYKWYGFCTPEGDRGKLWKHWSRRPVLQGAKALFLALTRYWKEDQILRWHWNPFRYVDFTDTAHNHYCHEIIFNLVFHSRKGVGYVGGFSFILAGEREGWKNPYKYWNGTWVEKMKRFFAKTATVKKFC